MARGRFYDVAAACLRGWLSAAVLATACLACGCGAAGPDGDDGRDDGGPREAGRAAAQAAARSPRPPVTSEIPETVRVLWTRGGRLVDCPAIARVVHSGVDSVRGGCALRFSSDDMAVLVLTPVGDLVAARCRFDFVFNVASNTTGLLADRIEFGGPGLCARVERCADGETGLRYPWQGSKLTGPFSPSLDMNFDICVNTPLGRARGMLYFRLARHGNRWVATPYDHPIGDSSVRFSGSWEVEPDGFEVRPATPSASSPGP